MEKKLMFVKTMNIIRIVVLAIVVVLVVAFVVGITAVSNVAPATIKQGKSYTFVVLSQSMSPDINAGDLVVVKNVAQSEIEVGDVICFFSEDVDTYGWKITHRVNSKVCEDGQYKYQTISAKGDIDRTLVSDSRVIGEVQRVVPKIGNLILFMQGQAGYVCFILLPLGLLIVLQSVFVVKKFVAFSAVNRDKAKALRDENDRLLQEMQALKQQLDAFDSETANNTDDTEGLK